MIMIRRTFRLSIIIIICIFLWQQLLWAGCDLLRPLSAAERKESPFALHPKEPAILADPLTPSPLPPILADPLQPAGPSIIVDPLPEPPLDIIDEPLHGPLIPPILADPLGRVGPSILVENSPGSLDNLNMEDWIGEDLLNEFAKLNNGREPRQIKVQGNLTDNMSALGNQLKDIPDDEFVCLIIHNKLSEEEDGVDRIDHRIVIDKASDLKKLYGAIVVGQVKIGGLGYAMTFSYYPKRNAIHFHEIALAKHAAILRGKGLMSKTFKKIVEILRVHYPGLKISTTADSEITAHWFIKYFNAKYVSSVEELGDLEEYVDIDWVVDKDKVMIGEITPPEGISQLAQTGDTEPQKPGEEPPADSSKSSTSTATGEQGLDAKAFEEEAVRMLEHINQGGAEYHLHGSNAHALIGMLQLGGKAVPSKVLRAQGIVPLSGESGGMTELNQNVVSTFVLGKPPYDAIRYADLSAGRKKAIVRKGTRMSFRVSPSTIDETITGEEALAELFKELKDMLMANVHAERAKELRRLKDVFDGMSQDQRAEIDRNTSIPIVICGYDSGKQKVILPKMGGGLGGEAAVTELTITSVATLPEYIGYVTLLLKNAGRADIKVIAMDNLHTMHELYLNPRGPIAQRESVTNTRKTLSSI